MPPADEAVNTRGRYSAAIQDYLKAIYTLGRTQPQVTTSLLAEHLGFKPASVTGMLKTMADLRLVAYTPYHGVELTPTGEQIALEMVRHHRLLELYLVEALGYSWDEVHDEAERLEHHISEKLEARIAAHLGELAFDPHGDPIPTLEGQLPAGSDARLADLVAGESAASRVCAISTRIGCATWPTWAWCRARSSRCLQLRHSMARSRSISVVRSSRLIGGSRVRFTSNALND